MIFTTKAFVMNQKFHHHQKERMRSKEHYEVLQIHKRHPFLAALVMTVMCCPSLLLLTSLFPHHCFILALGAPLFASGALSLLVFGTTSALIVFLQRCFFLHPIPTMKNFRTHHGVQNASTESLLIDLWKLRHVPRWCGKCKITDRCVTTQSTHVTHTHKAHIEGLILRGS